MIIVEWFWCVKSKQGCRFRHMLLWFCFLKRRGIIILESYIKWSLYIKWKGQTHTYLHTCLRVRPSDVSTLPPCLQPFFTAYPWLPTPSLHLFGIISLLGRGGGWYRHRL
jgi:hypothetical protein